MDYRDFTFNSLSQGQNYLYGYSLCTLPDQIYSEVKGKVNNFSNSYKENVGKYLAGQIDEEYNFPIPNSFDNWLKGYINLFQEKSNYFQKFTSLKSSVATPTPSISLASGDTWINYQYKYEYNPPHIHSGILSWVLWYQIPYLIKNEQSQGPGKNKLKNTHSTSSNGIFQFQYVEGGNIAQENLFVDKTWEKLVVLFPADLNHTVYPFYTSDEARITIAGNVKLE